MSSSFAMESACPEAVSALVAAGLAEYIARWREHGVYFFCSFSVLSMVVLQLLGAVRVRADSEPLSGRAAQRHRLALLALLAAHTTGLSRDRLLPYLWPESDTQHARNLLSQALSALREGLGANAVLIERDLLRLNPECVRADLWAFRQACEQRQWQAAVQLYRGPFLDGFFLSGSVDFERWVDEQRAELTALYAAALQAVAQECMARGDAAGSVRAWRQLAALEPLNGRIALALMKALADSGNRAGAIQHAGVYAALLREELGAEPEPEVTAFAEQLRLEPQPRAGGSGGNAPRESAARALPGHEFAAPISPTRVEAPSAATVPAIGPTTAEERRPAPPGRHRWWRTAAIAATAATLLASVVVANRATRRLPPSPGSFDSVLLAVLPFHILSESSSDAFLAVGLADAVITRLTSISGIRVRPTTAILPFEHEPNLRSAARALEVGHLLIGTVQRTEDGVRASVQLVPAATIAPIWSREYHLASGALPLLPDSVAIHLAEALRLTPARPVASVAKTTTTAYETYLRGRARLARQREPEIRAAIADFEAVIGESPDFALAYAGLARASAELHLRFATRDETALWAQRAVAAARRALDLDESLAEVYEALAAVHRKTEFDWEATIDASRRALALNPSAALPWFYIGGALYHLGLLAEAERAVRMGQSIQPGADRAEALRTLAIVALADGRYAEAVSLLQDVQRLSDRPVSDTNLAAAYFYLGDHGRAERLLLELMESSSASAASRARATLASVFAATGRPTQAAALLADAELGAVDHHVAYSLAAAHAQLGHFDEALRWLRLAADTGFRCYPWFLRDPLLQPLRDQPPFRELMTELQRDWEHNRLAYRT